VSNKENDMSEAQKALLNQSARVTPTPVEQDQVLRQPRVAPLKQPVLKAKSSSKILSDHVNTLATLAQEEAKEVRSEMQRLFGKVVTPSQIKSSLESRLAKYDAEMKAVTINRDAIANRVEKLESELSEMKTKLALNEKDLSAITDRRLNRIDELESLMKRRLLLGDLEKSLRTHAGVEF
jgi:septal ring factor EnvC (AmiA/AmiB activator)